MRVEDIRKFAEIPRPGRGDMKFMDDLCRPMEYRFRKGGGRTRNIARNCMRNGIAFQIEREKFGDGFPETALESLHRVLSAKKIEVTSTGYLLTIRCKASFRREEYSLKTTPCGAVIAAGDPEGVRRAVYFLEDRIREAEGKSVTLGTWHRHPFVRNRISRCFFGPTYRAPFWIDELTNDINYYPEYYLDRLAHEGINGLWLTMYFRDFPSSVFPGRGTDAEQRFAKLRETVARCKRYGIRIYVFFCEPKLWGVSTFAIPKEEAKDHPELLAGACGEFQCFCQQSEIGKAYIEEAVTTLFTAVPGLGGMINIMLGEDNGTCAAYRMWQTTAYHPVCHDKACETECRQLSLGKQFHDIAECFLRPMKRISPDAEFIGWFYVPVQRDDSDFVKRLKTALSEWPDDAGLMLNFESGGVAKQFDIDRNVFDYSLAYVGPSQFFRDTMSKTAKSAAKLQVGCSHEDASVPFIPVPLHLYRKYQAMKELNVSSVMQCWYFGNYPGPMNKAAGELSFQPFSSGGKRFLEDLAGPDWGCDAKIIAKAWQYFSAGYECFPANLAFAWYGPLHHSIVWPLHLFPVDEPMAPSWLFEKYPQVSGDRIGEILIYQHTLEEALALSREMRTAWNKGVKLLRPLKKSYAGNRARIEDIMVAEAIGLQIESTCNVLEFYSLREDMLFNKQDNLSAMRRIVRKEITCTKAMVGLCRKDSRIGYHSEAEGYLFFPEKLTARITLLKQLLDEDFPRFDRNSPEIDIYTGKSATPDAVAPFGHFSEPIRLSDGMSWKVVYNEKSLLIAVSGVKGRKFRIEIEGCRLWPAVSTYIEEDGNGAMDTYILLKEYEPKITWSGEDVTVEFPLAIWERHRRSKTAPMRLNIRGNDFSWIPYEKVPSRNLFDDYNPKCAGWLFFEEGK
jgi:hypothetical protein